MTLRVLDDLAASGRCKSFTIDPWGNRNQQTGTVNEYFPASASTNQISIAGFSFDAAGRMLSGTFAPVAAQRGFSWDPRGQMLTYSEGGTLAETYQYDAFGRRVRAIPASGGASTFYFYGSGDGSHPAAEYTYPNWQNNVLEGGAVIATVNTTGTATYPLADVLGTTRQTMTSGGSLSGVDRFYAYGDELAGTSIASEYKYTGQIRDPSGLDHFAMRTYASSLGRWLTPDPSGLAAVDPNNPQSWNRYAYALNNPASAFDPLGLDTCPPEIQQRTGNTICFSNDPKPPQPPMDEDVGLAAGEQALFELEFFDAQESADQFSQHSDSATPGSPPGVLSVVHGFLSKLVKKVEKAVCSDIPSGRIESVGGAIGGIGGEDGSVSEAVNYNSGEVSLVASGGFQAGWNGGAQATVGVGFFWAAQTNAALAG